MKKFNRTVFVILLIASAAVFVGCDSNVSSTEESYVRFETGAGSRTIGAYEEDLYPADSLYWAYVAVKKSGLHTVGQSELTTDAVSDGKIVAVDSDGDGTDEKYILKEVGKGPSVGLNVPCGPFSYGDWYFKIFGYKGYDLEHRKFTDLVYTGETSKTLQRVNEPESGASSVAVTFALERATSTFWSTEKGRLVFSGLYFTVPQNLVLFSGAEVDVTVKEDTTAVASGKAIAAGDAMGGTRLPILFDTMSIEEFTPGTHTLTFNLTYKAGSTAQEGATAPVITDTVTVKAVFKAGIVTVLYGDVDEIKVNTSDVGVNLGVAVCKTAYGNFYSSLNEALKAGEGDVTLIADIPNVGMVGYGGNVYTDGHYFGNMTQVSSAPITFILGENRTYKVLSSIINSFASYESNVWIDTINGGLTLDAKNDNVIHTGTFDRIDIQAVANDKASSLGYHVNLKNVDLIEVSKGFVDIGPDSNITAITVRATAVNLVALRGTLSSTVGHLYHASDSGKKDLKAGIKDNTDRDPSDAYRMYTFNSFNGSGKYYSMYGIEGMYVDLPNFAQTGFTVPTRTVGGITSKIDFVLWYVASASWSSASSYQWDTGRIVAGTAGTSFEAKYGVILDDNHYCYYKDDRTGSGNYGVIKYDTVTMGFTDFVEFSRDNTKGLGGYIIFYKTATPVATDRYYLRYGDWVNGRWGLSGHNVPYTVTTDPGNNDNNNGDKLGEGKSNTKIIMDYIVSKSITWNADVGIWNNLNNLRTSSGFTDLFVGSGRELWYMYDGLTTATGKCTKNWISSSSCGYTNGQYRAINESIYTSGANTGRGGSRTAAGSSTTYGTYYLRAF